MLKFRAEKVIRLVNKLNQFKTNGELRDKWRSKNYHFLTSQILLCYIYICIYEPLCRYVHHEKLFGL